MDARILHLPCLFAPGTARVQRQDPARAEAMLHKSVKTRYTGTHTTHPSKKTFRHLYTSFKGGYIAVHL